MQPVDLASRTEQSTAGAMAQAYHLRQQPLQIIATLLRSQLVLSPVSQPLVLRTMLQHATWHQRKHHQHQHLGGSCSQHYGGDYAASYVYQV